MKPAYQRTGVRGFLSGGTDSRDEGGLAGSDRLKPIASASRTDHQLSPGAVETYMVKSVREYQNRVLAEQCATSRFHDGIAPRTYSEVAASHEQRVEALTQKYTRWHGNRPPADGPNE